MAAIESSTPFFSRSSRCCVKQGTARVSDHGVPVHLPQSEMSPARRDAAARVLPATVGSTWRRSADPLPELRVGGRILRRSASGLIPPSRL